MKLWQCRVSKWDNPTLPSAICLVHADRDMVGPTVRRLYGDYLDVSDVHEATSPVAQIGGGLIMVRKAEE